MWGCVSGHLWSVESLEILDSFDSVESETVRRVWRVRRVARMEPARKRRTSPGWGHFDLITPDKVRCLLCAKELGYNNTLSMLRHYRALHENKEGTGGTPSQATRKQELDEALVSMIVKDTQPSLGPRTQAGTQAGSQDPASFLWAVKAMVQAKYATAKEKAKAKVQKVAAVSLMSDMWTSINMDAYLAVTCHFVDDNTRIDSVLLGVLKFPQSHTAENLAGVKASLMEEWGITNKVTCLVTDGAANMLACG
ncbi:uncharacterized protein LOC121510145 [Cheilinus undulatus]|uniref:uncharacterized protein LOC121510145 n=1 Tax=Cheilinus undulatus TaxID=241271 RepID=UPI001BD4E435|nr:uncharacterized protein LOC121510145 [Cheilinus undulatus]